MRVVFPRGAILVGLLLAGAILLALFHGSAADRAMTGFFFDPPSARFPLKDAWPLSVVGHTGLKWAMLAAWLACLARGGAWRRGALYAGAIALAVSILKSWSPFSCPWDLPEFGGSAPQTGRCLPAAHPLTGFAFLGLYVALREQQPRAARATLVAAWIIGLAAGLVQVARGAHFLSHVLWAAWFAWALALLLPRLHKWGQTGIRLMTH